MYSKRMFGATMAVVAMLATALTSKPAAAQQASITLKNCNAALCQYNNTSWSIDVDDGNLGEGIYRRSFWQQRDLDCQGNERRNHR